MTTLTREIRDKRVAVMTDVLAQLSREDIPLRPKRGTYLRGDIEDCEVELPPQEGDMQPHVDLFQEHCECCLIGAAFLSYVRLYDGFPLREADFEPDMFGVLSETMIDTLLSIFSRSEINTMEGAFEGYSDSGRSGRWGQKFASAKDALHAIATIIIENDGEFRIPTKEITNA